MRKIPSLSAMSLPLLLLACERRTPPQPLPAPPSELIADLPEKPVAPAEVTDYSVGAYINALRLYGATVANRFYALKAWAVTPKP